MIVVRITKGIKIIMCAQVCLISHMGFVYEENGGKKSFSCKSKHQYPVPQYREHDCSANNKNNGHYYGYPTLSHLMAEL